MSILGDKKNKKICPDRLSGKLACRSGQFSAAQVPRGAAFSRAESYFYFQELKETLLRDLIRPGPVAQRIYARICPCNVMTESALGALAPRAEVGIKHAECLRG